MISSVGDTTSSYVLLDANFKEPSTIAYYVDSSITKLFFYVYSTEASPVFGIYNAADQEQLAYTTILSTVNTAFLMIDKPSSGMWTFKYYTPGVNLKITCDSDMDTWLTLNEYNEDTAHPSNVELEGFPLVGATNLRILAQVSGLRSKVYNVKFDFLAEDSTFLYSIVPDSQNTEENTITMSTISPIQVPNRKFRFRLNILLANDESIERYNPYLFAPTSLYTQLVVSKVTVNAGESIELEIQVELRSTSSAKADVYVRLSDTLGLVSYVQTWNLVSGSPLLKKLNFSVPEQSKLYGKTNRIILTATEAGNTQGNSNVQSVDISILSKNVSFDTQPSCVIVEDRRPFACRNVCRSDSFWTARLSLNETGSGLANINSILTRLAPIGSTFVMTYIPFVSGSKEPNEILITADCCTQNFDVYVSDIYANVGVCRFDSPESISMAYSMRYMFSIEFGIYLAFSNVFFFYQF